MKCPHCGEENVPLLPEKFRCAGCGRRLEMLPDGKIVIPKNDVVKSRQFLKYDVSYKYSKYHNICFTCFIVFILLGAGIPAYFGGQNGPTTIKTFPISSKAGKVIYVHPIVGKIYMVFFGLTLLAYAGCMICAALSDISSKGFEEKSKTYRVAIFVLWLILIIGLFVLASLMIFTMP